MNNKTPPNKADRPATLLGISLGTRSIGIAVIKDRELLLWKVQCFKGSWSRSKLSLITGSVRKQVFRSEADAVVIKIPTEARVSAGIRQLLRELERTLIKGNIPLRLCTLEDLKRGRFTTTNQGHSKQSLVEAVASRYPELQHEYRRQQRSSLPYYSKVFEAVACAWLGIDGQREERAADSATEIVGPK